ncbi:histone-like nucleoid-structuring protein Lsr2 [Nocardiopsis sp. NPDC049922]|uniref:Lsr2 family DNA-binding protein n=1 Tax=Nocardiopsis sp. NPDC049922 TaxID=3155157 RepID=UPI0034021620
MKMQITVCGVHYSKSEDKTRPVLVQADDGEPFEISVNGVSAKVYVCEECRVKMALNLHTMLMAGGVEPESTGMASYFEAEDHEESDDDGDDQEDEGEEEEWPEGADMSDWDDEEIAEYESSRTPVNKAIGDALKGGPKHVQDADNARMPEDDDVAQAAKARNEVKAKRPKRATNEEIRQWAKANGFKVGTRGGIRAEIKEAYMEAHS